LTICYFFVNLSFQ